MTYFIAGVIALIVFSGALNAFLGTNPKWLTKQIRRVGGIAAIGFGLFLLMRGQIELAIPAVLAGTMLLGLNLGQGIPGFGSVGSKNSKTPGRKSAVSTRFLAMELDLDTAEMTGRFIAGSLTGQSLETIPVTRLIAAFAELDSESASLLEAYLDRREPRWRDAAQHDAGPGHVPPGPQGAMTDKEAYEILGLQPGAGEEAIRAAHRSLMKKLHPDQGGSTWLATRVNQAKDILLDRHRRNS